MAEKFITLTVANKYGATGRFKYSKYRIVIEYTRNLTRHARDGI